MAGKIFRRALQRESMTSLTDAAVTGMRTTVHLHNLAWKEFCG
jgi:hypothetical protein